MIFIYLFGNYEHILMATKILHFELKASRQTCSGSLWLW